MRTYMQQWLHRIGHNLAVCCHPHSHGVPCASLPTRITTLTTLANTDRNLAKCGCGIGIYAVHMRIRLGIWKHMHTDMQHWVHHVRYMTSSAATLAPPNCLATPGSTSSAPDNGAHAHPAWYLVPHTHRQAAGVTPCQEHDVHCRHPRTSDQPGDSWLN